MVVNARSCAIRRWVYIQANQSLNWLTTVISPRIYWALKLVPVLWVSTPLPPQRTAHHPLLSGNPIYCWAATKYASIKAFGKSKRFPGGIQTHTSSILMPSHQGRSRTPKVVQPDTPLWRSASVVSPQENRRAVLKRNLSYSQRQLVNYSKWRFIL